MAKEIPFQGKTVVVRQLTVRETAEFFDNIGSMRVTTADLLMHRALPAAVVCTATGLTIDDLTGDVTPSELVGLWEAVEQENPFFLQTIERFAALEQGGAAKLQATASAPPPVSSPDPGTAPA